MSVSKNWLIIGTSHVSSDSILEIRKSFEEFDPDIVAVELDPSRLRALQKKAKGSSLNFKAVMQVGLSGFIFALVGGFIQRFLGKKLNMRPGQDMFEAVKLAMKNEKRAALVDRDISLTLKYFSKKVPLREKGRIVKDLLLAPFQRKKVKLDISKVPEEKIIDKLVDELKGRYPVMHEVLLTSRNEIMAKRIIKLLNDNENSKVMIVVGAAHKKGVEEILSKRISK